MNPILSDTGWHRWAKDLIVGLRQQKTPVADDLAEDIAALLSRAHGVETFRDFRERILGRLSRLCDDAQTMLLPKIVVGVTGASGGIGKETMFQAVRSGLVKKVIGLVRLSYRPFGNGSVSFIGGPVRLHNGLAVVPEPLEHHVRMTWSEKERWLKAMKDNCVE